MFCRSRRDVFAKLGSCVPPRRAVTTLHPADGGGQTGGSLGGHSHADSSRAGGEALSLTNGVL
eukprot:859415-Prorocentrum_minimum.AAC.1